MKAEIKAKVDELCRLTSKMEVPGTRRTSIIWLSKNLAVKNRNHPDFARAMELITELRKIGVF
jgi:hypothetical protein